MKTIEVKTLFIAVLLLTAVRSLPAEMEQARKNLFAAAGEGHFDIVKSLVENGAVDDTAKDKALTVAAWYDHLEVAKFLIKNGANVNAKDRQGETPLMNPAFNGQLGVVKFLIENGASINAQNFWGSTPLMHAVLNCRLEVVEFLIKNGANVNEQNLKGETVLMKVDAWEERLINNPEYQQKYRNTLKRLFVAKANPLLEANDGTTVLKQIDSEILKECMQQQIFEILVEEVPQLPKVIADLIAELTY